MNDIGRQVCIGLSRNPEASSTYVRLLKENSRLTKGTLPTFSFGFSASRQRHMNQVQCHLSGNVDVLEPSSAQTAFEKKKGFCSEQHQTVLVNLFERAMKWSVSKRLRGNISNKFQK